MPMRLSVEIQASMLLEPRLTPVTQITTNVLTWMIRVEVNGGQPHRPEDSS